MEGRTVLSRRARQMWEGWLTGQPEAVRSAAERLPPWERCRLSRTGDLVHVGRYEAGALGADARLTVVDAAGMVLSGISPQDLEPCPAPLPDECLVLIDLFNPRLNQAVRGGPAAPWQPGGFMHGRPDPPGFPA